MKIKNILAEYAIERDLSIGHESNLRRALRFYADYIGRDPTHFDYTSDTGAVRRFRSTSNPVSFSAVPEPSAFMLLGFVGLVAAGRRWRLRFTQARR